MERADLYSKRFAEFYDRICIEGQYYDYPGIAKGLDQILNRRSPVLELGIGTGNVALLLARKGYDVTGIDDSQAMLDILEQKRSKAGVELNAMHASAESMNLDKRFEAIYSHGGPLFLLYTANGPRVDIGSKEAMGNVLQHATEHLTPGGILAINIEPDKDRDITFPDGYRYERRQHANENLTHRTHTVFYNDAVWAELDVHRKQISTEVFSAELRKYGFSEFRLDTKRDWAYAHKL